MTIINTHVGWQLINLTADSIVTQWGPSYPPPLQPAQMTLPNGDIVHNPHPGLDYHSVDYVTGVDSLCRLVKWIDDIELPVQSKFDAEPWILRFTASEFAAVKGSTDVMIQRMWDFMLARGWVDVRSQFALAAKQHFIDDGLLTQDRADAIWDTVPSSMTPNM
jgi:hypothetical protein